MEAPKVVVLTSAQFAELQRLVMGLSAGQTTLRVGTTSIGITHKAVKITLTG